MLTPFASAGDWTMNFSLILKVWRFKLLIWLWNLKIYKEWILSYPWDFFIISIGALITPHFLFFVRAFWPHGWMINLTLWTVLVFFILIRHLLQRWYSCKLFRLSWTWICLNIYLIFNLWQKRLNLILMWWWLLRFLVACNTAQHGH